MRQGGLSLATLGAIERGKPRTYTAPTLAALDRALGWEVGHAQSILDDEQPQEVFISHSFDPGGEMSAVLADLRGALADMRREPPSWLSELGRIGADFDDDEHALLLYVARWIARQRR